MNELKTYSIKSIILLCTLVLFLSSCNSDEGLKDKYNDPFRKNLFNPFYIDQLLSTPNSSGSVWISKHVKQLDIDKISIVLKGGTRPDNVLEKYLFTFNKNGQNDTFQYNFFNISNEILNENHFEYGKENLSKINIIKYYGIGNLPPVFVNENLKRTIFYKSKANGKNDSLFYYPNTFQAKVIIDKIGNFNNFIEIIVPKESSSTQIMNVVAEIDSNLSHFDLSEKLLTYTENGYPVESYHLGENWNQLELAKKWEYNKYQQPIHFKQWLHGTLIKDIDILYNENSLPKKIIFNRKKYLLIYKKN